MKPSATDPMPTTKGSPAVHVEQTSPHVAAEKPWQYLAKYPKVLIYAVLINIGPLLFGYDMVIIGAVSSLPRFKMDFGEPFAPSKWVIPALWIALWNSFLQLGAGTGSILSGTFQDRFGRRATVFLGGLLGCIGAAVSYTSSMPDTMLNRRISFMMAKFVLGASCGFLMSSCQTWISETTPKQLRGVFLGFYGFNVVSAVEPEDQKDSFAKILPLGLRSFTRHRCCFWPFRRYRPSILHDSVCQSMGIRWLGNGSRVHPT